MQLDHTLVKEPEAVEKAVPYGQVRPLRLHRLLPCVACDDVWRAVALGLAELVELATVDGAVVGGEDKDFAVQAEGVAPLVAGGFLLRLVG